MCSHFEYTATHSALPLFVCSHLCVYVCVYFLTVGLLLCRKERELASAQESAAASLAATIAKLGEGAASLDGRVAVMEGASKELHSKATRRHLRTPAQ